MLLEFQIQKKTIPILKRPIQCHQLAKYDSAIKFRALPLLASCLSLKRWGGGRSCTTIMNGLLYKQRSETDSRANHPFKKT